jgi:hypothetical protein
MKGLTTVALLVGILTALALGGRPRHAAGYRFRWPAALAVGAGAQLVAVAADASGPAAAALVVVSYAGLLAFVAGNLAVPGLAIALAGLALNAAVMAVNVGMPVRASAIRAAGGGSAEVGELDFGPKHRLERPGDDLVVLADRIPVAVTGEVVSVGDIVLSLGAGVAVHSLLRPRKPAIVGEEGEAAPPTG